MRDEQVFLLALPLSHCHVRILPNPRSRVDLDQVFRSPRQRDFHHGLLYQLLAPRLLAYLMGLVRDKAAAEDILQLTFLTIHEARATYIIGANPIPWIYTVAHRTCLDELRKRKRSRMQLTKDGTLDAEPAADLTGLSSEACDDEAGRPDAASAAGALAALG